MGKTKKFIEELRSGVFVKNRLGNIWMYVYGEFFSQHEDGYLSGACSVIDEYDDNLEHYSDSSYDIVAIYESTLDIFNVANMEKIVEAWSNEVSLFLSLENGDVVYFKNKRKFTFLRYDSNMILVAKGVLSGSHYCADLKLDEYSRLEDFEDIQTVHREGEMIYKRIED